MKKSITFTISIIMVLIFGVSGCNHHSEPIKTAETSNSESSTTIAEKSDITSENSKNISDNNWKIKYYVDEFNDPTDESYISYTGRGTFSNSAVTNAKLKVNFLIDSDIAIKLYEYDNKVVTNYYSHPTQYDITVKGESGAKITYKGAIASDNGDRIFIYEDSDKRSLLNRLNNPQQLKFYIVNKDRPSSTYNFTIDTAGFAEVYDKFPEYN